MIVDITDVASYGGADDGGARLDPITLDELATANGGDDDFGVADSGSDRCHRPLLNAQLYSIAAILGKPVTVMALL